MGYLHMINLVFAFSLKTSCPFKILMCILYIWQLLNLLPDTCFYEQAELKGKAIDLHEERMKHVSIPLVLFNNMQVFL